MLGGPIGTGKENSLMSEYSLKLSEAILRHRMQLAERSARLEVEFATRIKSEFIANMSHELRTPLNTVIGFSKLLAEQGQRPLPTEDSVEYARLISDAAANLLIIINDILDMSKIQSGHFRLDAVEVNLDELLDGVELRLRNLAAQAQVNFSVQLPAGPVIVRGDAQKLTQAFGNLIGNAVKFTSLGGTVIVDVEVEHDGAVVTTIADTGVGMDQHEIAVALAPFGQVDGTRTRWREGTGLGLPIAKSLIEMHGGSLSIVSSKSVGTVVTARLPPPKFVAFMQKNSWAATSPALQSGLKG